MAEELKLEKELVDPYSEEYIENLRTIANQFARSFSNG
jgi:hypothetical protein